MHQFVAAGIVRYNPDDPSRSVNSPYAVYQIEPSTLELLRSYKTKAWKDNLKVYLLSHQKLVEQYARERESSRIPVTVSENKSILLSPGEHNELVKAIIEEFAPRFVPSCSLIYAGDTGDKFIFFDKILLSKLGIEIDPHGKMPDVMLYDSTHNWVFLVEAVTSHGPVNSKRHLELLKLFKKIDSGLVFVTAFPNRPLMSKYLPDIAWETEVWVIHFNGERFLGPYKR
jgi:hypothetical protein